MDSETAAQASASQKHHKHMMFGKKQRYIEVFQCSGEDMNLVLNGGGFQSSSAFSAKPLSSSGMLPSLRASQQQAQPLQISIPPPLTLSLPQTAVLQNATSANVAGGGNQNTTSLIAQQQQAHFIAQQSLIARQQAAAAAAQIQAAQQQSDQMTFFQNFGFLQSPTVNGVAQGNPYAFPMSPQMPQFYFLPRPSMLPMGLMPTNALSQMQYPGIPSTANYGPSTIHSVGSSQMSGGPQNSTQLNTSAGKRSYESAFRNDSVNVSAAKRAFHPTPGTGNIYPYPYPQL
jgi:hypothetical protein